MERGDSRVRRASPAAVTGAAPLAVAGTRGGAGTLSVTDPEARHRPPGRGRVLSRQQASWLGRAPENRGQGCPGHPSCHSSFGVLFQKVTALSWWCLRRPFQPACHLSPPVRSVQGSRGLTSMALTFRAGAPVSAASDPSRRPHEQPTGRPVAAAASLGSRGASGPCEVSRCKTLRCGPCPGSG